MRMALLLLFGVGMVGTCGADPPQKMDARLNHLMSEADRLTLSLNKEGEEPQECQLYAKALLRYTNPLFKEQSDGALFLWTWDSLPVAFASYSIRNDKQVFTEFSSVADFSLTCQKNTAIIWSPTENGFAKRLMPGAPVPVKNERLRLLHMKRLAERIKSQTNRLLPTPLYRYSSKKHDVIDGAVFALVTANDPEVLIVIEAIQVGDKTSYQYKLGRMSSPPRTVVLDDTQIWNLKGYWRNPRSRNDHYSEQMDSSLPSHLKQEALRSAQDK